MHLLKPLTDEAAMDFDRDEIVFLFILWIDRGRQPMNEVQKSGHPGKKFNDVLKKQCRPATDQPAPTDIYRQ